MKKFNVGILGATGMVGQRFVTLLENHPWFDVKVLAASKRSVGKKYEDVVKDRWLLCESMPSSVRSKILLDAVDDCEKISDEVDFVFSALNMSRKEIFDLEERYARLECPVVSNNSAHRFTEDVPMIIPEINPDHMDLIPHQRERLGTKRGFIVVKSNCSLQSYVPALTPLLSMGLTKVYVSTYQAISGAGKTFDTWKEMQDNIIPYIKGEEEKSECEPMKIWGKIKNGKLIFADRPRITANCVRVPVSDGHTASVFAEFDRDIDVDEILKSWDQYAANQNDLPSSPEKFLRYVGEPDFQLKSEREKDNGMAISIGRLQKVDRCTIKFISMSHNTIRGAAGGAILLAECLCKHKYI